MKRSLAPLFFLLFITTASQAIAELPHETASKLLQLSGIARQVEEFPRFIKAGMQQAQQQNTDPHDETFADMLAIVDDAMDPARMLTSIGNDLMPALDEQQTAQLLAWYSSNTGSRIASAEEHASTPEGYNEMLRQSESLLKNEARVEFAKRLDRLLGATDFTLQLHAHSQLAIVSTLSSSLEKNAHEQLERYQPYVEKLVEQLRADTEAFVVLSFVYSYKDISNEDLDRYMDFLATPAAETFNVTTMKGLSEAFKDSISRLVKGISEIKGRRHNTITPSENDILT